MLERRPVRSTNAHNGSYTLCAAKRTRSLYPHASPHVGGVQPSRNWDWLLRGHTHTNINTTTVQVLVEQIQGHRQLLNTTVCWAACARIRLPSTSATMQPPCALGEKPPLPFCVMRICTCTIQRWFRFNNV